MNPDSLEVKVQLSEVDAPKVRVGQKATIKVNAFNTKSYVAQVDRIDTIGTVSSGVVVYNAYLRFVSTPPEIYPSMNINAVIQIDRKDDVVKVPTSAIKIANDARTIQIMRTDKNLPETAEIHTGMVGDIDTEIMSGVQVGDIIVTRTITPKATSTTSPFSSIGGTRGLGGGGR
jgi:multidrug efflux pump subunit AcrA (membrane-fusion protein)